MTFFLIGFMGSGKTHWGKIWASVYSFTFIDLDEVIEKKEGKSIADIFDIKGEDYFREIEAEALRSFDDLENTIIACGGGTPCFYENMEWMNAKGTTIYLYSNPQEILLRVLSEQDKRPLIKKMNKGELLFFIEQKLKERADFYNAATVTIATNLATEQIFGNLLAKNQSPE